MEIWDRFKIRKGKDMEENYNNNKFYIPKNVSTRFEIVKGIGIKELIETGIATIIGIVIAIIVNGITGNFLLSMGIVAVFGGGTFVLNIKDNNNQSVISMIKAIIRFYSIQKYYKYKIKDNIDMTRIFNDYAFVEKVV